MNNISLLREQRAKFKGFSLLPNRLWSLAKQCRALWRWEGCAHRPNRKSHPLTWKSKTWLVCLQCDRQKLGPVQRLLPRWTFERTPLVFRNIPSGVSGYELAVTLKLRLTGVKLSSRSNLGEPHSACVACHVYISCTHECVVCDWPVTYNNHIIRFYQNIKSFLCGRI